MEKEFGDSIVSQKMFIPEIYSNILMRKFLDNIWVLNQLGIKLPAVKITRFDRLRWWFKDNVYWRFSRHRPDQEDY